jgi:hypothetical protein
MKATEKFEHQARRAQQHLAAHRKAGSPDRTRKSNRNYRKPREHGKAYDTFVPFTGC